MIFLLATDKYLPLCALTAPYISDGFLTLAHLQVIIITNSDDGWVKYSCERFIPRLLPVLDEYRIVSARTEYEKFYPGQPLCWKAAAFAHEVNELYESYSGSSDNEDTNTSFGSVESEESFVSTGSTSICEGGSRKEIVSFGDSMEERTSVKIVAEQQSAIPKSVMFVQAPSPLQIIGQLQMLTQHMKFVCEHQSSLDLEINPDQAQRFAESFIRRSRSNMPEQQADLSSMLLQHPAGESKSAAFEGRI